MLGGADNPNGELPSYITGADTCSLYTQSLALKHTYEVYFGYCHERCNSDPHPTPEIRSRG